MKRIPTIFLKIVLFFMAAATLAFCIFALPSFANAAAELVPQVAFLKFPFLICMYAAMLSLLFTLFMGLKLLGYIDTGKAFSSLSIKALKDIKLAGIITSILLYVAGMPAAYLVAEMDDAPGVVLMAFAVASLPLAVAAFAAVLKRLLLEIKSGSGFTA